MILAKSFTKGSIVQTDRLKSCTKKRKKIKRQLKWKLKKKNNKQEKNAARIICVVSNILSCCPLFKILVKMFVSFVRSPLSELPSNIMC